MNHLRGFVLILLLIGVNALEFPPQLKGLLPTKIEKFYRQLDKSQLMLIDDAFMHEHDNFYGQIKQLNAVDRQLAKRYLYAFSSLYQKSQSLSKQLKFFYFWRVIHVINDLSFYTVTENNLNKFASDVVIEWEMLNENDQKRFNSLFPEIVQHINSKEFQSFASIGRKLWSFERFSVPTN